MGDSTSKKRDLGAGFTLLQVTLDVLMIVLAFVAAYQVRLLSPHEEIGPFSEYAGALVVQFGVMLITFVFNRLYQRQRGRSRLDDITGLFGAVLVGMFITLGTTALIFRDTLFLPRLMLLYDGVFTFFLVSVGRVFHGWLVWTLRARGLDREHVLLVGTTEVGRMIQQKILHSSGLGYRVVGYVGIGDECPKMVLGAPVLGSIEDIPRLIQEHQVDQVIVAMPEATRREILDIVSLCEGQSRVSIKVFPDVFQIMASEVSIGVLDGVPLLTIRDPAIRGWRLAVKRGIDALLSALVLIFLSPFMLLTALLIKLDSPGPAFYFQERMGLDAKPFAMIKFRSMRTDAETKGPGWTTKDDPRRTRLGSLIRRLSIDEFPQFINVLLGDMSLVGPRPERPMYVEQFRRNIPRYMDRHREKAGLTGWAQVNGLRGDTSIAERTKYDLWYIENWSLMLDLKIIARTALKLFSDRQAY